MTHAVIYKSHVIGEVLGFKTYGHSGYADEGSDIVCSAISLLVINTINAIDTFTDAKYETQVNEDEALISFMLTSEMTEITSDIRVLLNALELGLSQVAAGNPDYLSISIEEV